MSRIRPRKRPCRICRKWFMPDVRQAGRQKTCSTGCSRQLHCRSCADWNSRNAAYFKSNYLDKKLQQDGRSPPDMPQPRINLKLPRDIIADKIGKDTMVIAEYITEQIFTKIRTYPAGFG